MIYYHIICIGCGGTGSYFIKEFSRFMATYHDNEKSIYLSVVDGDRVEEKNLSRQSFFNDDINSFKATSLVAGIKECMFENEGNTLFSYPFYIDTADQIKKIDNDVCSIIKENDRFSSKKIVKLLIGTVDNHRARQEMHKYFYSESNLFYFDSANEYSNGEVVFAAKIKDILIAEPRSYYFSDIMKDDSLRASEISCSSQNKVSPQHITTNMLAGNILLSKTIQLITTNKIQFGITYFDAFIPSIVSYPFDGQVSLNDK